MTVPTFGPPPDPDAWVSGVPEDRFPLTPESLLQWLRQENRVPMLYWDQFRTRVMMNLAGEEWQNEAELKRALAGVDFGF